jgi:peptide-methionine (S)-S-oxide reductase
VLAICSVLACLSLSARAGEASAVFAGGCFWCMEPPFDKLDGVISTTSGYTGGELPNPTYEQVSAGGTGHYEAVKVVYDDSKVSYGALLNVFWRNIDPFDGGGQFCDRGSQYESAIFVENDRQRRLAEASKRKLQKRNDDSPVQTKIRQASAFYPAEEYHQDYYSKNPLRYRFYRFTCGRDSRLSEVWGDSPDELRLAPVSPEN